MEIDDKIKTFLFNSDETQNGINACVMVLLWISLSSNSYFTRKGKKFLVCLAVRGFCDMATQHWNLSFHKHTRMHFLCFSKTFIWQKYFFSHSHKYFFLFLSLINLIKIAIKILIEKRDYLLLRHFRVAENLSWIFYSIVENPSLFVEFVISRQLELFKILKSKLLN
jgi:hypothetical protein